MEPFKARSDNEGNVRMRVIRNGEPVAVKEDRAAFMLGMVMLGIAFAAGFFIGALIS